MIATIYRAPQRDRHGDPVDAEGDAAEHALVGTATGVIPGGAHWHREHTRGEVASTKGQIGFPRTGLIPEPGDRIMMAGVRYQVVGRPEWDYESPLTGSDFGYAWVGVEAR